MVLDLFAEFVIGIDHVGIAVVDVKEAKAFYSRALGMISGHEETNEEQGIREAMIEVGATGTCLQLLEATRDDSPIAKFMERTGPGIHHLAFRVTNVDGASAHLREAGVRLLYDEPRSGTAGSRINFAHPKDTGGVLIELVEPAPEARA